MKSILCVLTMVVLASFVLTAFAWADLPTGTVLKWSQPIYKIADDPAGVPTYWGWDQPSFQDWSGNGPQVADDWRCKDKLPVTDFHWWGSYLGSMEQTPAVKPWGFSFGIYDDIPAQSADDYSRPGKLLWLHITNNYQEKFVGYDVRMPGTAPIEATFQYNVSLPQSTWFYQPGSNEILWLSIRAIEPTTPFQEWGWKTRPHYFQDDAVTSTATAGWSPIYGPDNLSWDMAFEISTVVPEPGSLAALGSGLIGLAGLILRRKR